MAKLTLKGNPIETLGELPASGNSAKDFSLLSEALETKTLADYGKRYKVLNVFPSLDTGTCAISVKKFNQVIKNDDNTVVLNISKDLPFAMGRFCKDENLTNVETLSAFRSTFSEDYGLTFKDGPLQGLCSRAVIVLDSNNTVVYTEQVSEITSEPNYDAVLDILKNK